MKFVKNNQRGDTLVEVLIAITVLGIIVVGCMAIMNRSLVSIMNSAERTAVRAEVNSQTELLNYVRAKDSTMWSTIKTLAFSSADLAKASTQCKFNTGGSTSPRSFYLTVNAAVATVTLSKDSLTDTNASTGAQGNGKNLTGRAITSKGIWVDAVYYPVTTTNKVPYFDFYIKACWTPLGNNPDSQTVTIVRIYDDK